MNNQNNKLTLLEIIREQKKKKNRPLKVVCDWDEVIQPCNPKVWLLIIKEKGWGEKDTVFDEKWFQYFWENSRMQFSGRGGESIETGCDFIEPLKGKSRQEIREICEKPFSRILGSATYYDETPLLSCAEDLLKAFKEGLIEDLFFISTTRGVDNRKKKIFSNVFATYLDKCSIMLKPSSTHSRTGLRRADVIKEERPDFDIFIDDNPLILKETMDLFNDESKVYCSPDYKYYYTTPSWQDLKSKNPNLFLYQTYLTNVPTKKLLENLADSEKVAKKSPWKNPSTYFTIISIIGLIFLVAFLIMAVRKKRK